MLPPEETQLTPDEQFKRFSDGSLADLKKDLKGFTANEPVKATENGIVKIIQAFGGTDPNSGEVGGVVLWMGFDKPIGVFSLTARRNFLTRLTRKRTIF